jgi:hypothetical protein
LYYSVDSNFDTDSVGLGAYLSVLMHQSVGNVSICLFFIW